MNRKLIDYALIVLDDWYYEWLNPHTNKRFALSCKAHGIVKHDRALNNTVVYKFFGRRVTKKLSDV
jgi:hypothetical protein